LRKRFLPLLEEPVSLEKLNEQLASWIDSDYHSRVHCSTGQTPLERYLAHLSLLRPAPRDLRDYFRTAVRRKVDKDRTVSLYGKIYEAPLGLIGKVVTLLFHEQDLSRIEVLFDEASQGFLLPLNAAINSRVRRTARQQTVLTPEAPPKTTPSYRGGSLFESGASS
jgi:putative transposase